MSVINPEVSKLIDVDIAQKYPGHSQLWYALLTMAYNPEKCLMTLKKSYTASDVYNAYLENGGHESEIFCMNDMYIYNIFKYFPDLIFLFSKETLAQLVWREASHHTMLVLRLIKEYIGSERDTTELYKYVKDYVTAKWNSKTNKSIRYEGPMVTETMIDRPYVY